MSSALYYIIYLDYGQDEMRFQHTN